MQVFETIGHRLVLIARSYFCVGVGFQIPQGVSRNIPQGGCWSTLAIKII
jgi:hypothetical protein